MSQTSEDDSPTIFFRLYAEPNGKVFLLYEAIDQRVEVIPPVNKESLEAARGKLITQSRDALKASMEKLEGRDEATANAQQKANRSIRKAIEPEPRPSFWIYVTRRSASIFEKLLALTIVLWGIGIVYKGVELSQDHLPEYLHWLVLTLYVVGLTLCVYLMATDEKRRKETNRIKSWFGPSGMLVLPGLTLMAAASVFASVTLSLYRHGLVTLQECAGRPVAEGSLTDFYMWHFIKLVPLVKINEVLKLNEPLCYSQKRVGLLILIFQALVVIPSINTVLYYWKNRKTLSAPPFDYVYDPDWQPVDKSKSDS